MFSTSSGHSFWVHLEAILEPLGSILGHLGDVLRPSWAIMKASLANLEPSWAILEPPEAILVHRGAILSTPCSCASKGASNRIRKISDLSLLGASESHPAPLATILSPSWAILDHLESALGDMYEDMYAINPFNPFNVFKPFKPFNPP